MGEQKDLKWADVKVVLERLPEFPSIWLTASVRNEMDEVRASLNRHWLVTQVEGNQRLPLNDFFPDDEPRTYLYWRQSRALPWIKVFGLSAEMLFISWSFEMRYGTADPIDSLDHLDFFYDKQLSLWYARGADVLPAFPNLRPEWDRTQPEPF